MQEIAQDTVDYVHDLTAKAENVHTRTTMRKPETPNTAWLSSRGVWPVYLILVGLARILLGLLLRGVVGFSQDSIWTVWSVAHNLVRRPAPLVCFCF